MHKQAAILFFTLALLLPSVSFAAAPSAPQTSVIAALRATLHSLLAELASLQRQLAASVAASASDPPPASPAAPPLHARPTDSLYVTGGLGYDISFNTKAYPSIPFDFAVIGVSGGKAFVDNARLASEFSWSHFASRVRPTIYMNINAPYGSTVAGHIGSPRTCPGVTDSSQAVAAANGEPSACEGYNYGYNAAKHAYAYAQANNVTAPLWWLDVEEANSWSATTTVNDATIQGAIDYLNAQDVRVGIYSVPYMWRQIAGTDFAPTQTLNTRAESTPTWFPIGITREVTALNACLTSDSFITGSPVWIIQYESSSTAVDQNISC
ncbi:MAG: hypothetical protein B7X04_02845 [Parcubacteria group bacterium 21-54-25]|nr:MAG: hypothetical protein B7X04_02845 [Parcubacteria group bacterium 21-54-25]HQU07899.1 hypothetical protein [Candidatus Paceibacterota bacterium]